MTVDRSANEVVTTNVLMTLDTLAAVSCSDTDVLCLPTVSVFTGIAFAIMSVPSSDIIRGAEPPAPLETVSVGSCRRGSAKIGSSVEDCMILPSTTCGTYTEEPLRWFLVSALVSVTFGAGAAGPVVSMLAIFTASAFAPRSSCSVSPTLRPVMLASRTRGVARSWRPRRASSRRCPRWRSGRWCRSAR